LVSGAGVPEHSAYPVTAADASMESAAKAPLKAAGCLSRDGGDGACAERAAGRLQQSADLHRRPLATARRRNATLLQPRGNGPFAAVLARRLDAATDKFGIDWIVNISKHQRRSEHGMEAYRCDDGHMWLLSKAMVVNVAEKSGQDSGRQG
jgi:hypothetical protein